MLEKMDAFFEARLAGYDAHMLRDIEGARDFYPLTASLLPKSHKAHILDLGCGTGLELEYFYSANPSACVTGIDLSEAMLRALKAKFPEKDLTLIRGSYFEVPLGSAVFDAAVSVESLRHFTQAEKTALYAKLCASLKSGGYFILTDYFALDDADEAHWFQELKRLKKEQGITGGEFYHYDTPLTVAHETEALLAAGFTAVEVANRWGATCCLKATK